MGARGELGCEPLGGLGPGDGTPHADSWRRFLSCFPFAPRPAEEGSGLHIRGSDGLGAGPDRESAPQPRHPHRPPAPWAYLRSKLGAVPGARAFPSGPGLGVPPSQDAPCSGLGPQAKASGSLPAPPALGLPTALETRPRTPTGSRQPSRTRLPVGLSQSGSPAGKSRVARRGARPFRDSRPSGPPRSGGVRSGPGLNLK